LVECTGFLEYNGCRGASLRMAGNALTKAKLKAEIIRQVEKQRQKLIKLSLKIHANPELAFKEEKASSWLTNYLAKNGFQIESGIGGLPTAFKASYGLVVL